MVISLRLGRGSEVQEQTKDSLVPLALSFYDLILGTSYSFFPFFLFSSGSLCQSTISCVYLYLYSHSLWCYNGDESLNEDSR